ncbi:MAG: C-terminal binding protein [Limisphaerales bacterium]
MSHSNKVVITDFIPDTSTERKVLGDLADVVALNAASEDEVLERVVDADAILLYHLISLTEKSISRMEKCRLIVRAGVGYDNVDWKLAREKGINVCNVPDYGTEDVADTAIGMMLTLARGIHYHNSRQRRGLGNWGFSEYAAVPRLRGRTFGIIGLGRIGTAAAIRAKALGMNVVFYDPYARDGMDKAVGVKRVETLEELLAQTYVLSPHCFLSPETHHMVNSDTIAQLPEGAYVINTSRGGVVDVSAVLAAVTRGHLAGAGLDVLETEPPVGDEALIQAWRDPDHPAHDRIIVNPHTAFYCEEGLGEMRLKAVQNIARFLRGEAPRNLVN